MQLHRLAKDASSKNGGCPAVYVDADNPAMMAVQAVASPTARAQAIELREGEVVGMIPAETVVRAARAYLATHPEAGTL